jgi:hypothetical protein
VVQTESDLSKEHIGSIFRQAQLSSEIQAVTTDRRDNLKRAKRSRRLGTVAKHERKLQTQAATREAGTDVKQLRMAQGNGELQIILEIINRV